MVIDMAVDYIIKEYIYNHITYYICFENIFQGMLLSKIF